MKKAPWFPDEFKNYHGPPAELADALAREIPRFNRERLYQWRQPDRGLPRKHARAIGVALKVSNLEDFVADADTNRKSTRRLPSSESVQVWPLQYPEFVLPGSRRESFAQEFVTKVLRMAGLLHIFPDKPRGSIVTFESKILQMERRPKSSMMLTLSSLSSLRRTELIALPHVVSLNALVRIEDLESGKATLDEAKEVLSRLGTKRAELGTDPFRAYAPIASVGSGFLERTFSLKDEQLLKQRKPEYLAEQFLQPFDVPPLYITDEVTALRTLAIVNANGAKYATLVLPVLTAESVVSSHERRELPAHHVAIGLLRDRDAQWTRLVRDLITTMLSHEVEWIATEIEEQYTELVEIITTCLKTDPYLYIGQRRVDRNKYRGQNKEREETVLIGQQARAFGRFAMRVDSRSLSRLPPDLTDWVAALRRSRQLVILRDSRDRKHIREVVLFCLSEARGHDPVQLNSQIVDEDLLNIQTRVLAEVLGREFDLEFDPKKLDTLRDDFNELSAMRDAKTPKSLNDGPRPLGEAIERFVTWMQNAMPQIVGLAKAPRGKLFGPANEDGAENDDWKTDQRDFKTFLSSLNRPPAYNDIVRGVHGPTWVARVRGQIVGLLVAEECPASNYAAATLREETRERCHMLAIKHLQIVDDMRVSGTTRELVRKLINYAAENTRYLYVGLPTPREQDKNLKSQLTGYGFEATPDGRFLVYEIHGVKEAWEAWQES